MKINLVINPCDLFIKKNNGFNNLFVDRFTYDHSENKKFADQFFSSKLDFNFRYENFQLSNIIFYEILECIKIELNSIFNKSFDQKFYEIILGTWLRKFIQQFVIKYKNIIEINEKFNIQSTTIYNIDNYNFSTKETQTIQDATLNHLWNSCIYSHILSNLNLNIELNVIKTPKINFSDDEFLYKGKSTFKKINLKKNIENLLIYLTNLLPNNSNVFIYDTGFDVFTEKKIDIMFGQIPRFYSNRIKFCYSNYNSKIRKNLNFEKFLKINNKDNEQDFVKIFNLIIKILNKSLPIFVVEDFKNLIKFSQKLNFPKNPKAICTSYAFHANEPFKFYLAIQKFINPKIKYFIYQHGGSYITRLDNNYNNELNTCDYFITWGDKTYIKKKNNIKFVNYKLLNKKFFKKQKLDKLLILTRSGGYNTMPYDRYSEGLNQKNITLKLCKKFSNELIRETIIRIHYSSKNRKENDYKNLEGFEIQYSDQNYFEAINNAKIILFNHDSTGMLETFALNKPTLCIWEKDYQHQNVNVKNDYMLLKKAQILFDDPDELYKHIVKIWDNPLQWWYSDNVQYNLKKFVKLYTKLPSENFVNDFRSIIKDRI